MHSDDAHSRFESNVNAESSQARADRAVPDAPQTKYQASADSDVGPRPGLEPTLQRSQDDGRMYAKASSYVEDYDEQE